jgi:hypothetical protein
MIKSFVLGLIAGSVTTCILKDSIASRINARTRLIRARAADRLRATADAIDATADAIDGGEPDAPVADTPGRISRVS